MEIMNLTNTTQIGISPIYSGPSIRGGQFGTSFLINRKIINSLLGCETINKRICKVRLRGQFMSVIFTSAYAPIEEESEEKKQQYYKILVRIYKKMLRYDIIIFWAIFMQRWENIILWILWQESFHYMRKHGKRAYS